MNVVPSGKALGATVEGLNLASPLEERTVESLIQSLGERGVLRFPKQSLTARQQRDFAARFGELEVNVASGTVGCSPRWPFRRPALTPTVASRSGRMPSMPCRVTAASLIASAFR